MTGQMGAGVVAVAAQGGDFAGDRSRSNSRIGDGDGLKRLAPREPHTPVPQRDTGCNRKEERFSALPAASADEAAASADEAAASTDEAAASADEAAASADEAAASADEAAASADDHLHGAGLSHDQQSIAESVVAAISLKVNSHLAVT
jgi:uncharacterized protein YceH (UPF0502 family)